MGAELLGAKELEFAFEQLPHATSKNVMKRSLIAAANAGGTVEVAKSKVPVDDGNLRDSIEVSTKLVESQKEGVVDGVEVYIGAAVTGDKKGHHGHLVEFGTSSMPAQPFLRPAWESTKNKVLKSFASEAWKALAKSARTLRRKAEKGKLSATARRGLR